MKRFQNILYLCESPLSGNNATIARAASLARSHQANLTVVDVIPFAPEDLPHSAPRDLFARMTEKCREELEFLVAPHRKNTRIHTDVQAGRQFLQAIRSVLRNHYDLLIKPAENPDYIERLFGSDDMHLLRKCPCPVWLMKPTDKPHYRNILAAIDFDPENPNDDETRLNREILDLACSLASPDSAALHLVHVWDSPYADLARMWASNFEEVETDILDDELARHHSAMNNVTAELRKRLGSETYDHLAPRTHVVRGEAKKRIPNLARRLHADLVVMGTIARTGIPGLFIGNTAEAILDQLQCSILTTKPPGFESPVNI